MAKAKTKTKRAASKPKPRTKRTRKSKTTAAAAAETKPEPEEEKEKSVVLRVEPIPEEEQENPSISRETFYATRTGKPLRGGQEQRRPFYFRETPYGLIFLFLGGTAALAYFIYQMYLDGRLPGFTPKPTTSTPRGGLFSEGGPDAWTYVVIGLVVLLVGATLEITGIGRRIAESLAGLFLSRGKGKEDDGEDGGEGGADEDDEEDEKDNSPEPKWKRLKLGEVFVATFTRGDGTWGRGAIMGVELAGKKFYVEVDDLAAREIKRHVESLKELEAKQNKNPVDRAFMNQFAKKIEQNFEKLKKNKIESYTRIDPNS